MPQSQPLYIQTPFVGRKRELQAYRQVLNQSTPWVLLIIGPGGMGKSFLLRHLAAHTPQDIAVILLNFANEVQRTDPLSILETVSWQIAALCTPQQNDIFEKTLLKGRDRLTELSHQMSQTIIVGDDASLQGASLNISDADRLRLREQQQQIREMTTRALYAQVLTIDRPVVMLLDTVEWLSEPEGREVGQWVLNELLPGIHDRLEQRRKQCSVVITSRVQPSLQAIEKYNQWSLGLPMLEQKAVEDYLEAIGMNDTRMRQRVYEITRGHALCVSIIGTLWQDQGEKPFTPDDLPKIQEQFSERALLEFVQDRLDKRLKSPLRELTRYGVLLRSFDLPLLQAVFLEPEFFPETEALDRFHQLISYPYIESIGNQHYVFHDLLRELQATEVREQEPQKWKLYHERALNYLTKAAPRSPEWYYHAIAFDEEQGISAWWDAVQEPRNYGTAYLSALFQVVYDVTLKLTPFAQAQRAFRLGRFYYSSYGLQLQVALESYEQALTLFRQVGSKLGEANVLQAMGDVQQFRKDMPAALESYEQALALFRQVGDRLGEANCYLAQGRFALEQEDYQRALTLQTNAYQLYQDIQDSYSQARLLFYRSLIYEAIHERKYAIADVKRALEIAQIPQLPFVDLLQDRLKELCEDID